MQKRTVSERGREREGREGGSEMVELRGVSYRDGCDFLQGDEVDFTNIFLIA